MKFASVTQIVVLALVSCAALFALDVVKNPQLWHATPAAAAAPEKGQRLTLWMNHLCCTGCLDNVRQALTGVAALDMANASTPPQLLTQDQADHMKTSLPDYGNKIEIPIADLAKLDFVALDRALRDKGMVPARMEISGVEHFRIEAKLPHLCCGMCERATTEQVDFLKAKAAGGQFRWLDSLSVDHQKQTIIAYARYLQPGKTMDVGEFLIGLNAIGYAPSSVQVVVGEDMQHVHQTTAAAEEPAHAHANDGH
jgi:hypothetical protein